MSGLLRICTAGSVDDGKSTLIGRLLVDSRSVYEDQLASVERASRHRATGPVDYSLFTDGLRAEREQGITIDVAYRYFATSRRKFILADTPGHEQYTRNMATGASTADVAVLLVDARHGLRPQSRRHALIARLLGISAFAVAINKMDLVGFDRGVFDGIRDEFAGLLDGAAFQAIPTSALEGDNVTRRSARTPWYEGPSLLEHLETLNVEDDAVNRPFRLPVQLVIRAPADFRGYAGRIVSGAVHVGERLTVQPSGAYVTVSRIVTGDGDLDRAVVPMSVTVVLDREIDISRGDVLTTGSVHIGTRIDAHMVWMDERPLDPTRVYLLKQATQTVTADVDRGLTLNEVGLVRLSTSRSLIFDTYECNRGTGSFIVIDPATYFTAGAGMIAAPVREESGGVTNAIGLRAAERLARLARRASNDADAVDAVRRVLEEMLT